MPIKTTEISVKYNSTIDITKNIVDSLISLTYTDNANGKKDDLQIQLENSSGKWIDEWLPVKGDTLTATIGINGGDAVTIGTFSIDEIAASKPPSVVNIKATSVSCRTQKSQSKGTANLSGEIAVKKTRNYTEAGLYNLALRIANECHLTLKYMSQNKPTFYHSSQQNESGAAFISRLCESRNLVCKITPKDMIILDATSGGNTINSQPETIELSENELISWSLKTTAQEQVRSVEVKFYDPEQRKMISYKETAKDTFTGRDVVINQSVKSVDEARQLAQAKLAERGNRGTTGSLVLVGRPDIVAGTYIRIKDLGAFSGKYFIDSANHAITSSGGYVLTLNVSKRG